MRVYKQNFWVICLVAVLVSSCQTMRMPETNIERLTAIEISYKNILDVATQYVIEGRLNNDQIDQLKVAFDKYEAARDIAVVAIELSEKGAFETQAQTMLTIISSLRTFVAEVEQ